MPEYFAPGVYVEETSYRSKSIEGVSTTIAGFVGPSRFGPIKMVPDIITSLADFEAVYGDGEQLEFGGGDIRTNFLWHAVRAFFQEGGQQLYVSRVFTPQDTNKDGYANATLPASSSSSQAQQSTASTKTTDSSATQSSTPADSGTAQDQSGKATTPPPAQSTNTPAPALTIKARFPGKAGNMPIRFTLRLGQNILSYRPNSGSSSQSGNATPQVNSSLRPYDVVYFKSASSQKGTFYRAMQSGADGSWSFIPSGTSAKSTTLAELASGEGTSSSTTKSAAATSTTKAQTATATATATLQIATLTITVFPVTTSGIPVIWPDLALDPNHTQGGAKDSFLALFAAEPPSLSLQRTLPFQVEASGSIATGLDVLNVLFGNDPSNNVHDIQLANGDDGIFPTAADYTGAQDDASNIKTGLMAFEDLEDISTVAAPGCTYNYATNKDEANTIISALIAHAQKMFYRIAVLDSGNGMGIADVRQMRAIFDSSWAAFYYPWVRVLDPITNAELLLPPSGFVAGIYARNDTNRAVYKAPANEVVNLAIGFEYMLNKAQQDILNPEGINCFRFFEGRGFRLWGARTASSDPEWKYVNLRRYFAYLEHSIDKGTQWAVFEPNGPALWANVRRTISDFLLNEWQSGALLGDKPEQAFFVRCDRSTMTQNDLDNGRLVCQVGVAPLNPAEYVIFRIGQWTADVKTA